VKVNGQTVTLTPTEYDILRILIQHAGKVLTHQQLVHAVWAPATKRMRTCCGEHQQPASQDRGGSGPAELHHNEPGVGYRLKDY